MRFRLFAFFVLGLVLTLAPGLVVTGISQDLTTFRDDGIANWSAPPMWGPSHESRGSAATTPPGETRLSTSSAASLPTPSLPLIGITPCRIADTRDALRPPGYGIPFLAAGSPRNFVLTGQCGIAPTAEAVSLNITVTNTLGPGFIKIFPEGAAAPVVSTLNFLAGQTVANAAIVPLGTAGGVTIVAGVSGTDLIIDTNGYYDDSGLITQVTAGTGLAGGGSSGNVTLGIANEGVGLAQLSPVGSSSGQALVSSGSAVSWGSPAAFTGNLAGEVTGPQAATVVSNAQSANTPNAIVRRDGAGSFSAAFGTFSGDLSAVNVSLSGNLALPSGFGSGGSSGVVTIGGAPFLHELGISNTFVGSDAGNFTMTGSGNNAFGEEVLRLDTNGAANNGFGSFTLHDNISGMSNCAFGSNVLSSNTSGSSNSAFGDSTLFESTGSKNSAFGASALLSLSNGSGNTAIGVNAGLDLVSGSNNIYLANNGSTSESATIRLGSATQTATFIAGISGATSASGVAVLINSLGKLGTTTSSQRFKEDISDLGDESDVLLHLRPVAFFYKPEYDPDRIRQYGLVAEEVAQVAPGLVVFDKDGRPETVRYHLVNAMLLNEVQKQHRTIRDQQQQLDRQASEIKQIRALLEGRTDSASRPDGY